MVSASKDGDDADNEHRREELPPAVDNGNSSSGSSLDDTVVVLVVPQRWTKEAYALASSHGLVARRWHLEGRYGSRTHRVSEEARTTGFPLLPVSSDSESSHRRYERLLSRLPGGSAVAAAFAGGGSCYLKPTLVRDLPPLRAPVPEPVDATVHPERRPKGWSLTSALAASSSSSSSSSAAAPAFTFVELFAGVGGFGVALQELGGACVLASEIDDSCARTFRRNVRVPVMDRDATRLDADDVPPHDLLVAGFPCQPFSALGTQTGISGDDGRGALYRHIVRVLRRRRPRAFLLENVPGLAVSNGGTDLASILEDTRASGYDVTTEVCSSRALTAQARKRLYFVGIRSDLASSSSGETFRFPFQPDLGLRAGDVLDTPENVAREEAAILAVAAPDKVVVDDDGPDDVDSADAPSPSLLALTPSQFSRLRRNKRWKPARLAWPDTVCDTLDSHYGNSVGRGGAQLVPRPAPSAPRRFSPSECARIMGFCPETFRTNPPAPDRGTAAHLKERYREFGNAVCPPVVAAIGGAVLRTALSAGRDVADVDADARRPTIDWEERGRTTAVRLALRAVAPHRREAVRNRLSSSS